MGFGQRILTSILGGYFNGGDVMIKSNFPTSFDMTLISWSVIEYISKYKSTGKLNHVQIYKYVFFFVKLVLIRTI